MIHFPLCGVIILAVLQGQGPSRQQLSLVCSTTLTYGQNPFHLKLGCVQVIILCCTAGTRPVASATQPCVQHNPRAGTKPVSSETRFCMQNIIPCCIAGTRPVASATQPCVLYNPRSTTMLSHKGQKRLHSSMR